jgi:Protein of unknown function (DUF2829)
MDFSEALNYLKAGYKIARSGWNGKGMFLILVPGSKAVRLQEGSPYYEAMGGLGADVHGELHHIRPHIDLFAADRSFQPGWLASQSDILASDWFVAP